MNDAAEIIYDMVDPNANLIFGSVVDNTMPEDTVSITIIATGFGQLEPELGALADARDRMRAAAPAAPRAPVAAAPSINSASSSQSEVASAPMVGQQAAGSGLGYTGSAGSGMGMGAGSNVEIPAFLRRRRMQGK